MKYAVKITETLSRTIIVDTDVHADVECFEDAVAKVETAYSNEEIILDAEDFDERTFGESLTFGRNPIDDNDERVSYFSTLKGADDTVDHPCIGCVYFDACGDSERTMQCDGRIVRK